MAYRRRVREGSFVARVGLVIVGSTVALTLSFFGLVSLATGGAIGIDTRMPFYVLGMAALFVAGVVSLDQGRQRRHDGRSIILAAGSLAIVGFVLLALGGEGVVYASRHPTEAFAARRSLYVVAAGLMATGVGYWGVRYRGDLFGTVS